MGGWQRAGALGLPPAPARLLQIQRSWYSFLCSLFLKQVPNHRDSVHYFVDPKGCTWASWQSKPLLIRSPPLTPYLRYPTTETVFEYFVDPKARTWASWESKLSATYKPPADQPFFKIMVPTVDTVRSKFVASALVRVQQHTLIVGNVGVGKTMIVQSLLEGLPADKGHMVINFSAQTSSNSLQVRVGKGCSARGWDQGNVALERLPAAVVLSASAQTSSDLLHASC